jgi:hypothetical protein
VAKAFEQGIGNKIRIREKSFFNAVAQDAECRGFISECCICFRNFVSSLRIPYPESGDPNFQSAKDSDTF